MRVVARTSRARSVVALLAVAAVLGLSACTTSPVDRVLSRECVPRVVTVSQVIARPGDHVDIEAQAAGCAVRFTDRGRLTVSAHPEQSDDVSGIVLATIHAARSGAFRARVVIPAAVGPGDWIVRVSEGLPDLPCDDTGGGSASCASPEAYLRIGDDDLDYSKGGAHTAAEQVASRIERDLHGDAGFLAAEVLPGGVQVSVAHPFRDRTDRTILAAQHDAVALMAKVEGAPADDLVPVIRFNALSNLQELRRLESRVLRDRIALGREGIVLDAVTIDRRSATVDVTVHDYSDESARVLAAHYPEGLRVLPATSTQLGQRAPAIGS